MQTEVGSTYSSEDDIILLAPTGSGKTLAFLLPLVEELQKEVLKIQALILVPSRELALQIEQVARDMGTGYKINAFYGGRPMSRDKQDLSQPPALLIGTPGRIADHIRRESFDISCLKTIVLDEFDKSLEIGFETEMSEILKALSLQKRMLTSATQGLKVPEYVGFKSPKLIDYLEDGVPRLELRLILSPQKDKLETLGKLLEHLPGQFGIVFCNFRESILRISQYLDKLNVAHGYFHGGLDQIERELALTKFRNGTFKILLSTDLAARGLDIPEMNFIIHYHLPIKTEEFTHRNGRTARMHKEGTAYILHWEQESLPAFIKVPDKSKYKIEELDPPQEVKRSTVWQTIMISAGRKDKISKGDIAGFVFKQAGINKEQVGIIELKQNVAFVAIDKRVVETAVDKLNKNKIKKQKVRVNLV